MRLPLTIGRAPFASRRRRPQSGVRPGPCYSCPDTSSAADPSSIVGYALDGLRLLGGGNALYLWALKIPDDHSGG